MTTFHEHERPARLSGRMRWIVLAGLVLAIIAAVIIILAYTGGGGGGGGGGGY
jgi:hypothetical protein